MKYVTYFQSPSRCRPAHRVVATPLSTPHAGDPGSMPLPHRLIRWRHFRFRAAPACRSPRCPPRSSENRVESKVRPFVQGRYKSAPLCSRELQKVPSLFKVGVGTIITHFKLILPFYTYLVVLCSFL